MIERWLENFLFASRWLLAPLFAGLVFGLVTVSALAQGVIMSVVLGTVTHGADASLGTGLSVGLVTGLAVILPALGHRLFAGHTVKVWVLECGNDLLNFVLMGAVLSFLQ